MTEKKKRVRPTLTQVRALENELKASKANYENLSGILDEKNAEIKDLRSKYEALEKKYNKLQSEHEEKKKLYDEVCKAHDDTMKSNRELSDRINELTADNDDYASEIIRLKSRGLLSRIFNL